VNQVNINTQLPPGLPATQMRAQFNNQLQTINNNIAIAVDISKI
jgi:hypothetical protein